MSLSLVRAAVVVGLCSIGCGSASAAFIANIHPVTIHVVDRRGDPVEGAKFSVNLFYVKTHFDGCRRKQHGLLGEYPSCEKSYSAVNLREPTTLVTDDTGTLIVPGGKYFNASLFRNHPTLEIRSEFDALQNGIPVNYCGFTAGMIGSTDTIPMWPLDQQPRNLACVDDEIP